MIFVLHLAKIRRSMPVAQLHGAVSCSFSVVMIKKDKFSGQILSSGSYIEFNQSEIPHLDALLAIGDDTDTKVEMLELNGSEAEQWRQLGDYPFVKVFTFLNVFFKSNRTLET